MQIVDGFNLRQWQAARRCFLAAELQTDDRGRGSLEAASRKLLNGSFGMERRGHQSGFTAPARERDGGGTVSSPSGSHAASK